MGWLPQACGWLARHRGGGSRARLRLAELVRLGGAAPGAPPCPAARLSQRHRADGDDRLLPEPRWTARAQPRARLDDHAVAARHRATVGPAAGRERLDLLRRRRFFRHGIGPPFPPAGPRASAPCPPPPNP